MISSTSSSESVRHLLPDRAVQRQHLRKLLLRIVLPFCLILTLACWGLEWFVRHQLIAQTPSHGAAKLFRIQAPAPGEIPIIGSSRALCTYIPDSLGPHFYNYGVNGIGFAVMDIFLKRALARPDTTPVLLNFDYEMFYYQMGDVNSYLPHTGLPEVRPLLRHSAQYSLTMEIPGIRYFGAVDMLMKDCLNEQLQLTKSMNHGAAIDKTPFNAQQFAAAVEKRQDSLYTWTASPALVDTLFARVRGHRDRRFLLVVAPYHSAYFKVMEPRSRGKADALLARLDAEPNVQVIQWDTQAWPDEYFLNTTHVNMAGAIHTSRLLRDQLSAAPAIPSPATQDSLPMAPSTPAF